MKIAPLRMPLRDAPPLTPPVTGAEMAWWKAVRGPFRLRVVIQFGAPMFVACVATKYVKDARFSVPFTIFLALITGLGALLQWAAFEGKIRDQEIRWKRIRDDLDSG